MENNYEILKKYGYQLSESGGSTIIEKKNIYGQLGILTVLIGSSAIVSAFVYLALNEQTGFNPVLLRVLISSGIILPLVGLGIRSARNKIAIKISEQDKTIFVNKKDKNGLHEITLDKEHPTDSISSETLPDRCRILIDKSLILFELKRTDPKKEIEITADLLKELKKTIA